jgi:hypothetical protein
VLLQKKRSQIFVKVYLQSPCYIVSNTCNISKVDIENLNRFSIASMHLKIKILKILILKNLRKSKKAYKNTESFEILSVLSATKAIMIHLSTRGTVSLNNIRKEIRSEQSTC